MTTILNEKEMRFSEFDKGYIQCLIDISNNKVEVKQLIYNKYLESNKDLELNDYIELKEHYVSCQDIKTKNKFYKCLVCSYGGFCLYNFNKHKCNRYLKNKKYCKYKED